MNKTNEKEEKKKKWEMKNEKNDDECCRFEMKWEKNIRRSCVNVIYQIILL
jgi:hypothetical protein